MSEDGSAEKDTRTCSDNPCVENSKCLDTQGGGFTCQCKPGFTQIAGGKCQGKYEKNLVRL